MRPLGIFIAVWLTFSAALGLSLSLIIPDEPEAPGVVRVDQTTFTDADLQTQRRIALGGQSAPDAPAYTRCVAEQVKQLKGAKQKAPAAAELRKQCAEMDRQLTEQAASMLIQGQWLRLDAHRVGVKVTDEEVQRAFTAQKRQQFPKDADFQKFLTDSNLTQADILEQVEVNELSNKLQQHYLKGKLPEFTDADLRALYRQNKKHMPKGLTFEQAKAGLRQQITERKSGEILQHAFGQITDRYRPLTECLADVTVPMCHNVEQPEPQVAPQAGPPPTPAGEHSDHPGHEHGDEHGR